MMQQGQPLSPTTIQQNQQNAAQLRMQKELEWKRSMTYEPFTRTLETYGGWNLDKVEDVASEPEIKKGHLGELKFSLLVCFNM